MATASLEVCQRSLVALDFLNRQRRPQRDRLSGMLGRETEAIGFAQDVDQAQCGLDLGRQCG